MKKYYYINRIVYWLLQWTWGIVQNLCGLVLFIIWKIKKPDGKRLFYHGAVVTDWGAGKGSMGLGMFIFFGHKGSPHEKEILVHEYGHTVQSAFLGPFFLTTIGIPSFVWANVKQFERKRREKNLSYYHFYPEKWANDCGERVVHLPAPESRRYRTDMKA